MPSPSVSVTPDVAWRRRTTTPAARLRRPHRITDPIAAQSPPPPNPDARPTARRPRRTVGRPAATIASPVDPTHRRSAFISYAGRGLTRRHRGGTRARRCSSSTPRLACGPKVLRDAELGLDKVDPSASSPVTGGATPPADLWVVYLDGETATQAANACQKAHLTLAGAGATPAPDQCAAATYQVVSRPAPVLPSAVVTP